MGRRRKSLDMLDSVCCYDVKNGEDDGVIVVFQQNSAFLVHLMKDYIMLVILFDKQTQKVSNISSVKWYTCSIEWVWRKMTKPFWIIFTKKTIMVEIHSLIQDIDINSFLMNEMKKEASESVALFSSTNYTEIDFSTRRWNQRLVSFK